MVIDYKNLYQEEMSNVIYINGQNLDINNIFKDIEESENKCLIFINDAEQFIKHIQTKIGNDITSYLTKLFNLKKCYLVFNTDLFNIKKLAYESWFRQFTSLDNAIWIGKGLNNTTIHNLITPLRILASPLPPNFGYNIKNGKAIKIKVLEGDTDE